MAWKREEVQDFGLVRGGALGPPEEEAEEPPSEPPPFPLEDGGRGGFPASPTTCWMLSSRAELLMTAREAREEGRYMP